MILLWGIPSEPPMRLAVEAAERAGIEHVVINQRRAAAYDLVVDPSDPAAGWLVVDGREIRLGEIDGVYVRIMEPSRLPEQGVGVDPELVARSAAFHTLLLTWVEFAPCRVANRTAPMASNGSKPYQARLISDAGFDTPPTLVTDDPDEVARFEARHGPLVYKSTSSVRSIVRVLDDPARQRLHRLAPLPTQFQRCEAGTDVRVHVVDDAVFAARASSTAIDYRYATSDGVDVELRAMDLPDDVARRCVALAAALDLPFAGIDLRERPDGSWVCFEVNPSPGYSWYETEAGLPISDRLVMWLDGRVAGSDSPNSMSTSS
ncbi:MAG: alpha-L-glutamate ligase [Ilumatobacteraceae bacterium]